MPRHTLLFIVAAAVVAFFSVCCVIALVTVVTAVAPITILALATLHALAFTCFAFAVAAIALVAVRFLILALAVGKEVAESILLVHVAELGEEVVKVVDTKAVGIVVSSADTSRHTAQLPATAAPRRGNCVTQYLSTADTNCMAFSGVHRSPQLSKNRSMSCGSTVPWHEMSIIWKHWHPPA